MTSKNQSHDLTLSISYPFINRDSNSRIIILHGYSCRFIRGTSYEKKKVNFSHTKTKLMKKLHDRQLERLKILIGYSDRYEISVQFWPEQTAVFISKDGVELQDYGGSFDFAVDKAIEYLRRINPIK